MRIRAILVVALLLVAATALAKVLHPPWPWLYSGWPRRSALPDTGANTSVDASVSIGAETKGLRRFGSALPPGMVEARGFTERANIGQSRADRAVVAPHPYPK